ncbi:ion transporter [Candidatus Peregrinibacteria bacterium]|nr:ion transporter [bacterium]NCQ55819.1 ion transporter [Candidatus Parcubacteria bacterium]NCS67886.1 ion transporter [Candidatus Peregrinibacteria bacterium]
MKALIKGVHQFLSDCFFNHLDIKFHITNALIAFAVISTAIISTLQLLTRSGELFEISQYANQTIVTIFTVEYILRLIIASHLWRYAFSWQGLIDLLSITPFFLYTLGFFQSFQLLLMLRGLRYLKFLEVDEVHFDNLEIINKQKHYGSLNLHDDESLIYIARRSTWIFLFEILLGSTVLSMGVITLLLVGYNPVGITTAFALSILAILLCIRAWLNHHYDGIFITTQRIIIKEQELFGSSESEIPYEFIIDIVPDNRGLWNILFQMGVINIEGGTPQDQVGFKYIRHPKIVVEKIQNARKGYLPLHLRAIQGAEI